MIPNAHGWIPTFPQSAFQTNFAVQCSPYAGTQALIWKAEFGILLLATQWLPAGTTPTGARPSRTVLSDNRPGWMEGAEERAEEASAPLQRLSILVAVNETFFKPLKLVLSFVLVVKLWRSQHGNGAEFPSSEVPSWKPHTGLFMNFKEELCGLGSTKSKGWAHSYGEYHVSLIDLL